MLSLPLVLLLVSSCAALSIRRRSAQSSGCGQVEGNMLHSPGYPHNYPTSTHCMYEVPLQNNKALKIKFLHFDMEPSEDCSYDYVEVKDQEVSYGKYCGRTLEGNEMVIDDAPSVYIVFHSDKSLTKTGFETEFEHVNKGHDYGGHELETVTVANTEAVPERTTPFHPTTNIDNIAIPLPPTTGANEYNPSTQGEFSDTTYGSFATNEATPEVFPTHETTPEVDFPTNEATPEVFPTHETTPEVFPTNEATPEVFLTNEATSEVFPTHETTPEIFPTNEANPEVFPTNEATPEIFPTNEATPEVFPTHEATPEVFPTNEATPEVFPTNEATPEVFPTHEATSEVFPTDETTPEIFPTNEATPEVFPTNEATPKVFPTNEATPDVYPTNEHNENTTLEPIKATDKRQMEPKFSDDDSEEDSTPATNSKPSATDVVTITVTDSLANESLPIQVPVGNESIVSGNVTVIEVGPTEGEEVTEGNGDLINTLHSTVEPEEPTHYNPELEKHVLDKLKLMALLQRIKFASLQMEELLIGKIVEEEVHESEKTNEAKREMADYGIGSYLGLGRPYNKRRKRDLGTEFMEEISGIYRERMKKQKRSKQKNRSEIP